MRIILILLLITTILMSSAAPTKEALQPFELAMLDKLHQPWTKPFKRGSEHPRKGETLCNGQACKAKGGPFPDCEDCQIAVPLEFRHAKNRV